MNLYEFSGFPCICTKSGGDVEGTGVGAKGIAVCKEGSWEKLRRGVGVLVIYGGYGDFFITKGIQRY